MLANRLDAMHRAALAIPEVRRAAAFARNHAGPNGMFRRAGAPEERALGGRDDATEHVAAAAPMRFSGGFDLDGEPASRIVARKILANAQA